MDGAELGLTHRSPVTVDQASLQHVSPHGPRKAKFQSARPEGETPVSSPKVSASGGVARFEYDDSMTRLKVAVFVACIALALMATSDRLMSLLPLKILTITLGILLPFAALALLLSDSRKRTLEVHRTTRLIRLTRENGTIEAFTPSRHHASKAFSCWSTAFLTPGLSSLFA